MDATTLILVLAAVLGFYMAWNIGANDVANSMADAVGSRSITIRNAVIAAGICEFLGAVLVGAHVTDTIRKGIVRPEAVGIVATDSDNKPEVAPEPGAASDPDRGQSPSPPATAASESKTTEPTALPEDAFKLAVGMGCALMAAAVWLHLSSWLGMPVSTTHSIVGAVTGFGIVAFGMEAIDWGVMGKIVASWFISPILGALIAFGLFKLILWTIIGRQLPARAAIRFAPFLIGLVGFVMALSIFWKGLKNFVKENKAAYAWLAKDETAYALSTGIGVCCFFAAIVYLRKRLIGHSSDTISEQLERVERVFGPLVVITSCCVAFSHGANDVANSVGPLAAVVDIVQQKTIAAKVEIAWWILPLGGVGIVVGLATYGYRVMHTVGSKITQLTPSRGIAADTAATVVVLACSRMGLPVSTTHTLVGAILGVGLARGLASVDRNVTRNIFGGWLITVPAAGLMSAIFYFIAIRLL